MPAPVKLNLGCGVGLLGGFINVDRYFSEHEIIKGWQTKTGFCANAHWEPGAEYCRANILSMPFEDNFADYALLNNVIEHFAMREVHPALLEIRRVLKPGGELAILAPDFNCLSRLWAEHVATKAGTFVDFQLYNYIAEVIYGNQIGKGEFHRVPITPDYLNMMLLGSGFGNITVTIYPMHQPGPTDIDGFVNLSGVMRTDEIVARAFKPTAPAVLGIIVSEGVAIEDGMR